MHAHAQLRVIAAGVFAVIRDEPLAGLNQMTRQIRVDALGGAMAGFDFTPHTVFESFSFSA